MALPDPKAGSDVQAPAGARTHLPEIPEGLAPLPASTPSRAVPSTRGCRIRSRRCAHPRGAVHGCTGLAELHRSTSVQVGTGRALHVARGSHAPPVPGAREARRTARPGSPAALSPWPPGRGDTCSPCPHPPRPRLVQGLRALGEHRAPAEHHPWGTLPTPHPLGWGETLGLLPITLCGPGTGDRLRTAPVGRSPWGSWGGGRAGAGAGRGGARPHKSIGPGERRPREEDAGGGSAGLAVGRAAGRGEQPAPAPPALPR